MMTLKTIINITYYSIYLIKKNANTVLFY